MPKSPSKSKPTPSKSGELTDGAAGKRGRKPGARRKNQESFNIYIYKVLKQVHPEIGVSRKAMMVLNSYVHDLFDRLSDESAKLCQYTKRQTLGSREVQAATNLVLPGELAKHACSEGQKAVNKYQSSAPAPAKK